MIALNQVVQETEYNCGPAVIQMMLGYFGKNITQEQFVEAANITDWIKEHGTQPDQMVLALRALAPEFKILFKNKAEVSDLEYFIKEKQYPVAINWQGLFYDSVAEEPAYPSPDSGHYSIVTDIDQANDQITLADPYPDFASRPRRFSLAWFTERWWDIADTLDTQTKKRKKILTNQLLFVVLPKTESLPSELQMCSSVALS